MTAALYDPQEGYYARGAPIGERGDFVTSPYVSPAFAAAIARRFADDAEKIPGPIDFVEIGAGEGEFLEGFAEALARDTPSVAQRVRLTAIERSLIARQSLRSRMVTPAPMIYESVEELAERSVKGWIFSNELYDALPVVRVVGGDHGLEEMRVGVEGERFQWVRAPAPEAYREHLASFRVALESGQSEKSRSRRRHCIVASRGRSSRAAWSLSTTATPPPCSTIRRHAAWERSPCTSQAFAAEIRCRAREKWT